MKVTKGARLGWRRRFKTAPPFVAVDNYEFMDREKTTQRPVATSAGLRLGLMLPGVGVSANAGVSENQVYIVIGHASAEEAFRRLDGFAHWADERPVTRLDVRLSGELRVANVDEVLT